MIFELEKIFEEANRRDSLDDLKFRLLEKAEAFLVDGFSPLQEIGVRLHLSKNGTSLDFFLTSETQVSKKLKISYTTESDGLALFFTVRHAGEFDSKKFQYLAEENTWKKQEEFLTENIKYILAEFLVSASRR